MDDNNEKKSILKNDKKSKCDKFRLKCHAVAKKVYPTGFKQSSMSVLQLCLPQIVTNISLFTILTESVIICGHLNDKVKMGGVALGNSIITGIGLMIGDGITSASDTFHSQLYGNHTHRKKMGTVLQRTLLVVSLVPFVLWAIHINVLPFLIFFRQDPGVSEVASDYVLYFIPGLLFSFHFTALDKYLLNQNRPYVPMIVAVIGNVFNILSQYIAVQVLEYGTNASAMCQSATYFVLELLLILYIVFSGIYEDTWDGWSKDAFMGWLRFLTLAIPGALIFFLETMNLEISVFLSGIMGTTQLGVQTVLYQVQVISLMIPLGLAFAMSIRVGQALGENNPEKAVTIYRAGVTVTAIGMTIFGVFTIALKDVIPKIFSDNKDIIKESSKILSIIALLNLVQGLVISSLGAMFGCGKQIIAMGFVIGAYYIIGQPVGACLAFFTKLEVAGFWVGLLISLFIILILVTVLLNLQSWEKMAQEAQNRVSSVREILEVETSLNKKSKDDDFDSTQEKREILHDNETTSIDSSTMNILPEKNTRTKEKYRREIIIKCLIYVIFICILIAGILIRVFLPRSLYIPKYLNATTSTLSPTPP